MKKSDHDHSIFYKQSDSSCILLPIYVNNIVIRGSDKLGILKLKTFFQTKFQTKDLETFKYFLRIEIVLRKERNLPISKKYIIDLLAEIGMLKCKSYDTPMFPYSKLQMEDGELLQNPKQYR